MKEAFERGFMKAAMAHGVKPLMAVELLKYAAKHEEEEGSSAVGRYFGGMAVQDAERINQLVSTEEGMEKARKELKQRGYGEQMGHSIRRIAPLLGTLGAISGGLGGASLGWQYVDNHRHYGSLDPVEVDNRSEMRNFLDFLKHSGRLVGGAALGGLGGAALGGGLGLLGGAATGATHGAAQKFMSNHTSDESQRRALKMKAKHPYATLLPFGDVVGALKA